MSSRDLTTEQVGESLGIPVKLVRHLIARKEIEHQRAFWTNREYYVPGASVDGLRSKVKAHTRRSPPEAAALLDDVTRARWLVARPASRSERRLWRQAIWAVQRLLPDNEKVCHVGRDNGPIAVWIEERRSPRAPLAAVSVMAELPARVHPMLSPLRRRVGQSNEWVVTVGESACLNVAVSRRHIDRAIRVAQTLIDDAKRRGYGVEAAVDWQGRPKGVGLVARGHVMFFAIVEATRSQGGVIAYPCWIGDERERTGRLAVIHDLGQTGQAILAADGVRWRIDDRLERVFERLEHDADAAAVKRAERQAAEKRERHQREQAALEKARTEWLQGLLESRRRAGEIRELLAAISHRVDEIEPDLWEWMNRRADDLDPALRAIPPAPTVSRFT